MFDKDGYTNIEIPINFGTTNKPNLSVVYFGETEFENFTAELFFAVLEKFKTLDYELYYMDKKISDINFIGPKNKSSTSKNISTSDYKDED